MRRLLTLLVTLVCLGGVAVGCGDDGSRNNPVRGALGPMSDGDWTRVQDLLRRSKQLPVVDAQIVRSLTDGDLPAVQAGVRRLAPLVREGRRWADAFEKPQLKSFWVRYFDGFQRVVDRYGSFVALAQRSGATDADLERGGCELILAKRAVQKLDVELARRIVAAAPAEDRAELRRELQRKQAGYERAAGSAGGRSGCAGDQGPPALP